MANKRLRALVWDENPTHAPKEIYPGNIRGAVAEGLRGCGGDRIVVQEAHLDEDEQGITPERLANADVLLWWGHARHAEVSDRTAERVREAVLDRGLGFVALHSAHYARPFRQIMNAPGFLKGGWRVKDPIEPEEITVCAPRHPIAQGIEDFTLPGEEMYGAPFVVPPPSVVVFQSYFPEGGEYFPSGLCWTVGKGITPDFESGRGHDNQGEGIGRVFYFRPGHETVPTFNNPTVRHILHNAARWCARHT